MSIGVIDFYGLRTLSEADVRAVLPFEEGFVPSAENPLHEEDMERDIAAALGVSRVDLSLDCCYEPFTLVAYVGIEESQPSGLRFRDEPTGEIALPPEIIETSRQLETTLEAAIRKGDAGDDWSEGHALAMNADARALQEEYVVYADQYRDRLIDVLHHSRRQRALAASVLAYSADKQAVVPHLEAAALDPDREVRNSALRALLVMSYYADNNPDAGIAIDPVPLIALLDSVVASDRHKASGVLYFMRDDLGADVLEKIRSDALPSLIEMCQWKMDRHSTMPCGVLEAVVGLPPQSEPRPKEEIISAAMNYLPR